MVSVRSLQIFLVLVVVLTLSSPAAVVSADGGPAIDRTGGPEDRIEVVLRADRAPGPGGVATLTFEATPLIAAPDLEIEWSVPEGVELLGDELDSPGAVAARNTVTSQRQVRFPSSGTYKIVASATYRPAEGIQFAATGVLFFVIDEGGSRASDKDPDARSPMHTIMPGQSTTSSQRVNGPLAVNDDPCFTIVGNIQRIDRPPAVGGYQPQEWVPVRHAVVDIREEDLIFDDSYGEVLTNELGNFYSSFCDDDGWFDDELEIYIRLRAEIRSAGMTVVEVEDNSWIEEVYEFDSWVVDSEGGAITFNVGLNDTQSKVFNIADAIYDAWDFWNDSGGEAGGDSTFGDEAEAQWEPGWDEDTSYYDTTQEEINVADDPSDPDEWDESPIIHEWGHFADDEYSCDEMPGGDHSALSLLDDPEFAWSEGYPDYYQSAVRSAKGYPDGHVYIDIRGDPTKNSYRNLETWDVDQPGLVSVLNEIAIAAALWDLNDQADDGQDRVSHGHAMIQNVYTSGTFESIASGFFDDTCDFDAYARAWVALKKPTDAFTAAAIKQNTGYTFPQVSAVQAPRGVQGTDAASEPTESIWWNQLTYVVDNSQSMAGDKFNGVKTVLEETINDLENEPEGTEFALETFNNTSFVNQHVFAGHFFAENISQAASNLSTSAAADNTCQVHSLRALKQAVADEYKGEAWLFTDGETYLGGLLPVTVEGMIQMLNQRLMHASVGLLGLCSSASAEAATAEAAEAERLVRGAARPYVGLAADETPGGVVPYLLTAIGTGGQFLYVNESQMADAGDVLRAQLTHSAGAGAWSDYVSDGHTYRWDKLPSWEYNWIAADTGGTNHGNPAPDSYIDINLPQSFPFYGARGSATAHVFENGYLTFGGQYAGVYANTTLPNTDLPNNALYLFWDQLAPLTYPTSQGIDQPDADVRGRIYSKQEGDWFAIEYDQYQSYSSGDFRVNTFEVLLNGSTGEIRYQYHTVPDGAASATIGLENANASDGVQVSFNDVNGADDGMGYKFTAVPPQPAKTYSVTVDSLMSGVAFLLMGYSGSFEPLDVRYPDGTKVSCSDTTNVLCLDLGLVQYVQADADDRYGKWTATVDAGSTGSGTFSFVSMAASELSPKVPMDHTLSTIGGTELVVDMGQAVDGNKLTGWFVQPDDTAFGAAFNLHDDGAHGDGYAGDGVIGSVPFTPPGAGCAYLWVKGKVDGVKFRRVDRTPFCFQPLRVTSLGDGANYGSNTTLQFEVRNDDIHDHCYQNGWQWPEGWWLSPSGPLDVCINAGDTRIETVNVYLGADPNDLPSGTTGEVILSVVEAEEGAISDSASARVTRHRPAASISIHNPTRYLRPNGDTSTLEFIVLDEQGVSVADGTQVQLNATLGTIVQEMTSTQGTSSPNAATTKGGFFRAIFTSGATEGTAVITAQTGGASASTEIEIGTPQASRIRLKVADSQLPPDGSSTTKLTATVIDAWGTKMANKMVRIGVEGDGQMGTIQGGEVVSGTTNSNGKFSTTYTSGTTLGQAGVRAELLTLEGNDYRVVGQDRKVIQLGARVYLPVVFRSH